MMDGGADGIVPAWVIRPGCFGDGWDGVVAGGAGTGSGTGVGGAGGAGDADTGANAGAGSVAVVG